jgi:tetratricopeptide (TPR) repeat protein
MRRWLAVTALVLCPLFARASDESDVLRARGALLAAQGKCDEALPLFERAIAADPKEARAALLAGRCLIAEKKYAEAEQILAEATRRDSELPEIPLEVAIARYHQENYAGARQALEAARASSSGDARFQLYDGLVLLQEGKRSEGIAALERARKLDPKLVEPTASYFEGLALENQGNRREAQDAMDRVIVTDPSGRWGGAARNRLDRWALTRPRDYWAELTVGIEDDSNVVLRGDGVELPSNISDKSDGRAIWHANAGWQFLRTHDWGAGAMLDYTGTAQFDLSEFNYHYPIATVWVDRRITENLSAHMQGDYAYGWVDAKPYVTDVSMTPALVYTWAQQTYTRLFGRFSWTNYYFDIDGSASFPPPPDSNQLIVDRNRDGRAEQVGLEQGLPIDALNTQLTGTLLYTRYHAQGTEYSYRGTGLYLQSETDLPFKLSLLLGAGYTYRGYLNRTTFETSPPAAADIRHDHVVDTVVGLERPIFFDWLLASARWHYTNNASNVPVFDYDRSIIGGYLTFRLP